MPRFHAPATKKWNGVPFYLLILAAKIFFLEKNKPAFLGVFDSILGLNKAKALNYSQKVATRVAVIEA